MIDPQVFATVGTMLAGLLTALGAAAFGFRRLTAANVKVLQERIDELERDVKEEQGRTREARVATELAYREKEAMRVDMAAQIEEERAGRRADRLQHEADMQQRTRELGGAPP